MSRPDWNATWLGMALVIAQRSKCGVKVGVIIVDPQQRIVASGYSGPPRGYVPKLPLEPMRHEPECAAYCLRARKATPDRDPGYSDCPSSHAEANALMFADRSRVEGGTIYVTSAPCFTCAKMIANSGVRKAVWAANPFADSYREPVKSAEFLEQCGIQVAILAENTAVKIGSGS